MGKNKDLTILHMALPKRMVCNLKNTLTAKQYEVFKEELRQLALKDIKVEA